ncbi:MAG: dephospho-CoA kinase [archaeon]|nr:dephospho-CoA kinase [archaeon]
MLVGVTGNIGAGKSALMHAFERLGHKGYYADEMVNDIYKDPKVQEKIGKDIGGTIVLGGYVDKALLSIIVFNHPDKLKKLNAIVHPLVRGKILEIDHREKMVFVEVALLFEANMQGLFDRVILVKASWETRKSRAEKRGFDESFFKRVDATQQTQESKAKNADFVADNDGDISRLTDFAKSFVEQFGKEAKGGM